MLILDSYYFNSCEGETNDEVLQTSVWYLTAKLDFHVELECVLRISDSRKKRLKMTTAMLFKFGPLTKIICLM